MDRHMLGGGTEEVGKTVLELGLGRMNARSRWSGREETLPDAWATATHGVIPGYH